MIWVFRNEMAKIELVNRTIWQKVCDGVGDVPVLQLRGYQETTMWKK